MINSESRGCVKMVILSTLFISALCVVQVHGFLEGTCLRKEPPAGVLVVPQDSRLLLGCRGQVKVNGVKVSLARANNSTTTTTSTTTNTAPPYHQVNGPDVAGVDGGVSGERDKHNSAEAAGGGYGGDDGARPGESGRAGTEPEPQAPPTTMFQPTRMSGLAWEGAAADSDWSKEEGEEEEEEEEEAGGRLTRGLRSRPQWRRDGKPLQEGGREGERAEVIFEDDGHTLSLPSVREADSGVYSCHRRGKLLSSLTVVVADPPERPSLSCNKKSPNSKIRCDWTPSQPISLHPQCYLFLRKGNNPFLHFNCTYSRHMGRCWCSLEPGEDRLREGYTAYLCVTSAAGSNMSPPLDFTPWKILKPDPPSAVVVRGPEGKERTLRVSWDFPCSWKTADLYFKLHYRIRYRAVNSQKTQEIDDIERRHCIINDALPGVEYLLQLQAKEEFEGHWSDWSVPVYARTWTDQLSTRLLRDLSTTMDPFDTDPEGSGADDNMPDVSESTVGQAEEVWYHILWISGSCVLLSVMLAAYLFRHRDRVVSKLQSVVHQT